MLLIIYQITECVVLKSHRHIFCKAEVLGLLQREKFKPNLISITFPVQSVRDIIDYESCFVSMKFEGLDITVEDKSVCTSIVLWRFRL